MPSRQLVIAGTFAFSIICCLIGVGALIHLADARSAGHSPDREGLEDALQAFARTRAELETEIAGMRAQLDELGRESSGSHAAPEAPSSGALADSLAGLEADAERLQAEIARARAEAASSSSRRTEAEELAARVRELERKLEEARKRREELLAEKARLEGERRGAKSHPIMSIKGSDATRGRRVLFVDCRADHVMLQPGGERLGAEPSGGLEDTFLARAREAGYVVFLIRPDGFETFDRYSDAIRSANASGLAATKIDVGYEPIDADWVLRYPDQGSAE